MPDTCQTSYIFMSEGWLAPELMNRQIRQQLLIRPVINTLVQTLVSPQYLFWDKGSSQRGGLLQLSAMALRIMQEILPSMQLVSHKLDKHSEMHFYSSTPNSFWKNSALLEPEQVA